MRWRKCCFQVTNLHTHTHKRTQYDRLLAEAEAQLRGALATAGQDGATEEEDEEAKTNAEAAVAATGEVVALSVSVPAATAAATPVVTPAATATMVQPPAEFFRPTPVHITLWLRDV